MASTAPPAAGGSITEGLVAALSATWRAIQARHSDVPEVVLTLGSGTLGRAGEVTLGHFARDRWQRNDAAEAGEPSPALAELFIGGEGLRRGSHGVLGTLLHEAAHGVAAVRAVKDTSRAGRYHNKRFKTLAEELGVSAELDGTRGWSATTLPAETAALYTSELAQLDAAITAYRRGEARGQSKPKDRNYLAAVCGCPRRIRVARAVLAEAPILCGACEQEFLAADDDEG